MKAPILIGTLPGLKLVEPDVDRDAPLSVGWLNDEGGRATMLAMGNDADSVNDMLPTSLVIERQRVKEFIEDRGQLNWMIEYDGVVVGSVWVNMLDAQQLPAPAVHIMIGDPAMRGKGIGYAAIETVMNYLYQQGRRTIYSRHLCSNDAADGLLSSLGFTNLDKPYSSGSLQFQNMIRTLQIHPSS